ncbi:unnamed protein product [Phytophthora fragariaefolia]|uniref:Unnamed protein product n=1 Tax=Phytophthora fragariaefolia TaxID=1490495 RepID=A0A9W7D1F0_9STRA|nr:unnamed protein product [Phytophthora fragariaefolia]
MHPEHYDLFGNHAGSRLDLRKQLSHYKVLPLQLEVSRATVRVWMIRVECVLDRCLDSKTDVFCTVDNSNLGGNFSSPLDEHAASEMYETPVAGIGVRTVVWRSV